MVDGPGILTLEDEAGQEHMFEIVDEVEYEGERYLAVVPYVTTQEEAEAALAGDADLIVMRIGEENGSEVFDIVDDDEELYQVGGIFADRLRDLYEIEGEDAGPVS